MAWWLSVLSCHGVPPPAAGAWGRTVAPASARIAARPGAAALGARVRTIGHLTGLLEKIPLRRMAEPDEIAAAHLFFASDDAAYVTGQVLFVDGGISVGV